MCATLNSNHMNFPPTLIRQNNVDTHLFESGSYYYNQGKGDLVKTLPHKFVVNLFQVGLAKLIRVGWC